MSSIVLQETFLNDLAQQGRPSTFFNNSKNLASSSQELRPDITATTGRQRESHEKRTVEDVDLFTSFQKRRWHVESCWWTLFSQWWDFRFRNCIWDNFLTLWNFQSWKVKFKTGHVRKQHIFISQCTGSKTTCEMAKTIDELMTSRSILGRTDFSDIDMLDAMIAPALKRRLDKHIHFRKRVGVEEQRAQTFDRFSRGRQKAFMIYEHFRATGAYEAVQGHSNLFSKSLQNDDVQDFDVRWDQALLSASEMPSNVILEGLYKSKLQDTVPLQTVLALYGQEIVRNNGQTSYLRLKTAVKLHVDQMIRTRNFRVRNDVVEKGSVTKSQEHVERKVRECFQWKAHGQCSKGDSCRFSHDTIASGNSGCGQGPYERSSFPAPNSKAKTDGKEGNNSMPILFLFFFFKKNTSCKFGHLPVCQSYKSEKGYIFGDKCHFRHAEAEVKPNKWSKKGGAKGPVALFKESTQMGCVVYLNILIRENLFYVNQENWHRNTPSNSPKAPAPN